MSKISDAQDILSVLGLPPAQQNDFTCIMRIKGERQLGKCHSYELKNKQGYYGIC